MFPNFVGILVVALFFVATTFSQGPQGIEKIDENADRVDGITERAEVHFKSGIKQFLAGNEAEARSAFDNSVKAFLMSEVDVQKNDKLRECYSALIEIIYRIEFPSNTHRVNIRRLSTVCGWNLDEQVATDLEKYTSDAAKRNSAPRKSGAENGAATRISGFTEQSFEPSPLDELSKLVLTEQELDVDSSDAKREFQYYKVVIEKNRSLGFSFQMHRLVQQYINYYRGRGRRTMEIGLYRSGMFMPMARRIFREEGIPENIAWLGQVESMWKPTASSWAAAVGLWQFIPGTGSRYGLKRTSYVDERRSFEKATRASARYLRFLYRRYGNWELAIAGYNCGEGNVDKAIRRAGVKNFWAAYAYLPRETRNYVPNILATIIIANDPVRLGFGHVRPARPLNYQRITLPGSTNLSLIAQSAGTSIDYIRYLNPELRTRRTPPYPYIIRVPGGSARKVASVFRKLPKQNQNNARLANAAKGETWTSLSRRTGQSVATLRKLNPGMKYPTGRVIVPNKGNGVNPINYSRPTNRNTASKIKTVTANSGETVEKLVERLKLNVSAKEVAQFNGLFTTSRLNAGRVIKIPPK